MNEAETRAELIDPRLKESGWGVVDGSKILREYNITAGKIQTGGGRAKPLIADYVLVYRGRKLAAIEAKSDEEEVGEGVAQAKNYAEKMHLDTTYATNGKEIYQICMTTGKEGLVAQFPSPDELWNRTFAAENEWRDKFSQVPLEDVGGTKPVRYYQEIAVNNTMSAIAEDKHRILLTMATGTGKTFIAFQIAWKLFQTRWNLKRDGSRRPRILFLADRNILADQAFNAFSAFPEDTLVRINPKEIGKKGSVPTNGSIFFTIFQTFMSGGSTVSPTTQKSGSTGSPTTQKSGSTSLPTTSLPVLSEVSQIKKANGYMYILECADNSFYTGSTNDLKRRLEQHQNGDGAEHTKKYLPVKLVYYETFNRIDEAFNREKQVQGWNRAKKIALINGQANLLRQLSMNRIDVEQQAMSLSNGVEGACPDGSAGSLHRPVEGACPEPVEGACPEPVEGACPEPVEGYFGEYPADYFDFIIIDECHRGGANDEGSWRGIMEYFSPAVQLGLTATPKRKDNADTYKYFGEPVYIYSLKEGINDGFLTPFKVKRIKTTIDDYIYTSDDQIIEGEIEEGKIYTEPDFNRIIEIKEREAKRVQIFLSEINQNEKALAFCASQDHAMAVRDLVNQYKNSKEPNYCVRVTANDGALGEQYLREFQDNEKTIPTILTTSQKLSTGVDARNIRNIILMRPVNSMIEFKQIVGRGTRLFDGKEYFTIYDFVDAYHHFADQEWDGEPVVDDSCPKCGYSPCTCVKKPQVPCPECGEWPCICIKELTEPCPVCGNAPCICSRKQKVKIKLRDGKEREIQHMIATSFWSADGRPISAEEFLQNMFGKLPDFFKSEEELRKVWSNPITRKILLEKLADAGYGKDELTTLQKLINAEKSDLFDVLEYVSFAVKPITREARVAKAQSNIFALLNNKQKEFLEFVLSKYIETGVEELDQEKLPELLTLKYHALDDAKEMLGSVENIRTVFIDFQKYLYEKTAA